MWLSWFNYDCRTEQLGARQQKRSSEEVEYAKTKGADREQSNPHIIDNTIVLYRAL